MRNSEISLYVDTMIVETLLTDSHLSKFAQEGSGLISGLVAKVKEYFGNHVDPNDKAGSLLTMIAPGAISLAFGAMGLPWLGTLIGLATNVFHINTGAILKDIYGGIKAAITGNKPTSSSQVDAVVDSAIKNNVTPATEEEAAQAEKNLDKKSQLRDAKLLKLAMIEMENSTDLTKLAGIMNWFSGRKANTGNLLGVVLKWIFKVALASAGLMVAGDVINKFLDRPNALDGSLKDGKPVASQQVVMPAVISKQTRFPVNPGYSDARINGGWSENVTNNPQSIATMVMGWAKQIYKGLDNLDSVIANTAGFQTLVDNIAWYNHTSEGGPVVFIPPMFTSRKMAVDHFMDEVAEKAPK